MNPNDGPLQEFWVEAGVVIQIGGIPLLLPDRIRVLSTTENWSLVKPVHVPIPGEQP